MRTNYALAMSCLPLERERVLILVEGSNQVGSSDFALMTSFVKSLTRVLLQNSSRVVAIGEYSNGLTIAVNFSNDEPGLQQQIDNGLVRSRGMTSNLGEALHSGVDALLSVGRGHSPIVIVLAVGQPSSDSALASAVNRLDIGKVDRLAIGLGDISQSTLEFVTGSARRAISGIPLTDLQSLEDRSLAIVDSFCDVQRKLFLILVLSLICSSGLLLLCLLDATTSRAQLQQCSSGLGCVFPCGWI